ncbi:protein YIPF2 [Austrofundulus limnaeus]|uniref:Protein YIPF n=1 Tax=Austrofundulus limnaeus TaxID=52670 RepID=A0A2I4CLQ1_AUSLI|nr:PREDICTED: protein YIPF1-like [Austrofundulus limnaeus]
MASPKDLQFQEFEEAAELLSADPGASTLSMSANAPFATVGASTAGEDVRLDVSEDEEGQEESSELLGEQKPSGGFWTFEYYQSFFNVDTLQVLDRVKGSVMPLPGRNFIKHYLRSNPDLYGPFWICMTLVFSVAISGNLSTFLRQMGNSSYHYRPQFHRVTIAAIAIFLYAWLVPVGLWAFLTWRQGAERQIGGYSFLETVCVYGYSLFIFIPTSILWIIPLEWLQWALIVVAMVISGSVLVLTFWPVVRDDSKVMAVGTVMTILVLHALLAIGCKLYFFQTPVQTPSSPLTPTAPLYFFQTPVQTPSSPLTPTAPVNYTNLTVKPH